MKCPKCGSKEMLWVDKVVIEITRGKLTEMDQYYCLECGADECKIDDYEEDKELNTYIKNHISIVKYFVYLFFYFRIF